MTKKNAIENAEGIIESFGGIRPMAGKLGIAVTTVQGWKKRGVIPESRRDQIAKAAQANNMDLEQLFSKNAPANVKSANDVGLKATTAPNVETAATAPAAVKEKIQAEPKTQKPPKKDTPKAEKASTAPAEVQVKIEAAATSQKEKATQTTTPENRSDYATKMELKKIRSQAIGRSVAFTILIILALLAAAVYLIGPQKGEQIIKSAGQVGELSQKVEQLESRQDTIEIKIPGLDNAINTLKSNSANVKEEFDKSLTMLSEKVSSIGNENVNSFISRMGTLEQQFSTLQNNGGLQDVLTTLSGLQQKLTDVNTQVSSLKEENADLSGRMEGVSGKELSAAVMMIGLTKLRSSLDRNAPLTQDLALLRKLVGDDAELAAAIDRLQPFAENGVLTPAGLQKELKGLSNDILTAKLAGEEISIKEKMLARLDDIVQISKDGEMPQGDATEARVERAKMLLDQGNVDGAMAELKALQGPEAEAAAPWMKQAEAYVNTQKVMELLNSSILKNLSNNPTASLKKIDTMIKDTVDNIQQNMQ